MLYAVKGNKQLKIDEAERATYLKLGYHIAEVEGDELKIVEVSPSSTIPYAKFKEILAENEELKAQLEGAGNSEELEKLKAENEELKAKIKDLEKPPKNDKK